MDHPLAEQASEETIREGRLYAIDLICPLLENWVDQASRNEQSACQTRNSIIFGMTVFITGGATILAAFKLHDLPLLFASVMAFVTLFLNHVFEQETKAWRETVKILARIQYNIVALVRGGARDIDLQTMIAKERGLSGTDQPKTLTLYDIAKSKRRGLRYRDMDWGSRLLYGFIFVAALVTLYELHRNPGEEAPSQTQTSSGQIERQLPSPPRPES